MGGSWLWTKTQPNVGTSSGLESSSKPDVGSTQVRCRWLLDPLVLLYNFGGKKSPAFPLGSPPTSLVLGSLGKTRWPLHALRGAWTPDLLPQSLCNLKSRHRRSWEVVPLPRTRLVQLLPFPMPAKWRRACIWMPWLIRAWPVFTLLGLG